MAKEPTPRPKGLKKPPPPPAPPTKRIDGDIPQPEYPHWDEKVTMFQVNPSAASLHDIARMAEELQEFMDDALDDEPCEDDD